MASYPFSGTYQAVRPGIVQVRYVAFTVTTGGTVTIEASNTGVAGNGDDSQIKLFAAGSAGHIGDLVAEADGFPTDTMTVTLSPGTYILAISESVLTVAEAGNGDNDDDDVPPFGFSLTITEGSAIVTPPVEALVGTDAAESFTGTAGKDTIWAHGGADVVDGGGGDDLIFGDHGADRIDGGAGNDVMDGGFGNDIYTLDSQQDAVIEVPAAGTDEIRTALAAFTMAGGYANVEILTGTSAAGQALTGNDEANTINGAGGVDTLRGAGGDDTLVGNDGNDILHGDAGNDTLRGGLGVDQLTGGDGNDTYVIDTADTITELAGGGSDTVRADFSYTLGAELENLTLTGTGAINGTGNALANLILGNGAANSLDGGIGADTMQGGSGNDTYIYDNIGDRAYDSSAADGGVDIVLSSVTATLTTWVENLTLTGSADLTGVGNALANTIIGNSGNNVLSGAAGADTMIGGNGNDTYHYDHLGDRAHDASGPSGGIDTVLSSVSATLTDFVENLTLTGTVGTTGVGNALANTIAGNSADNPIAGMAGADILSGGGGDDSYVYFGTSDSTVAVRDRILGFDSGDRIDLSRIDANSNTAANDAFTFIGPAAFSGTAGELRAYQSAGDWFVEADVNGDGSADLMIAVITGGGHALAAGDFIA